MTTYPVYRGEVIDECRRRIEAQYPPTVQTVVLGDGGDPSSRMLHEMERLRACQDYLLAMSPIPHQYRSDHYWQGYPPGFRFQTIVQGVQPVPAQQPAPYPVYGQASHAVAPPQIINTITVGAQPGQMMPPAMPSMGPPLAMPYHGAHMAPSHTPFQQPANGFQPPLHTASQPDPSSPWQQAGGDPQAAVRPAPTAPPEPAAAPRAGSAPASDPSAKPIEPWSRQKEALYTASMAAIGGDAKAQAKIKPFADLYSLTVHEFCLCVIAERNQTVDVVTHQRAAAE